MKEQKIGTIYVLWYRYKNTCGLCDEWMDYDVFSRWCKKEKGLNSGRFVKTSDGVASDNNVIFVNTGDAISENVKYGSDYATWIRFGKNYGLCQEWEDFAIFKNWIKSINPDYKFRFINESGDTASPDSISIKRISEHKYNTWQRRVYDKLKNEAKGNICPEWDDFDNFYKYATEYFIKNKRRPKMVFNGCFSPETYGDRLMVDNRVIPYACQTREEYVKRYKK